MVVLICENCGENSADPDEMQCYVALHLGLHYLPKYLFRGYRVYKGLNNFCYFVYFRLYQREVALYLNRRDPKNNSPYAETIQKIAN